MEQELLAAGFVKKTNSWFEFRGKRFDITVRFEPGNDWEYMVQSKFNSGCPYWQRFSSVDLLKFYMQ